LYSQSYSFYNADNPTERLYDYQVFLYGGGLLVNYQPVKNGILKINLADITRSDSILFKSNFTKWNLKKSDFNGSKIYINVSQRLDEVVINATKEKEFVFYGVDKHITIPSEIPVNQHVLIVSELDAIKDYKPVSILVHFKGKNLFIPNSNKDVNLDVLLAFSNKEDLSDITGASFQVVKTKITKGRSHWLEINISTLNFDEMQRSKYIIYGIKPVDGIVNIKNSAIKNFPKHRNLYRDPRNGPYDLSLFSPLSENIPQIRLKLIRNGYVLQCCGNCLYLRY
jgi:hypothetical protein